MIVTGVVIVTGSAGLIGLEAALYFGSAGMDVAWVDNNMQRVFFGEEAGTFWNAVYGFWVQKQTGL